MDNDTNNIQVPEAFDSILNRLPQFRGGLVKELIVAAESGDYNAVAELTGRLKRADALKIDLERLQDEWQSVFNPDAAEMNPLATSPADNNASTAVPDQFELCSPTLQALRALGGKGRIHQIVDTVISQMFLSEEVTQQPREGSRETELEWQLGWSRTILKTCGMIDNPQPGVWELTELGSRQQWMEADEIKAMYYQRLAERRQRDGG